MLTVDLAARLRAAGLAWRPAPGDRFAVPDRGLDEEVFVLSNMVIEVHDLPDGEVIGFNGTTEWALDDVEKDEAVWLPREDQLRELLGGAFHALERAAGGYLVRVAVVGRPAQFRAAEAADAYAQALLHLIEASR
ncbi:MAG TPA: pilus assembly protein CpaE [Pilimelia sp.]|nr:pilus assembly protein CpaE [Pilimelia sp.]